MPLHHEPDIIPKSRPTGSPSAYSSAGEELDNARQANVAWRAAHKARFTVGLARLQRWTGPLAIGLGALAIVCFLIGFTLLGNSKSPSSDDSPWGVHVAPYLDIGVCCILAFLAMAVAALSLGSVSRWVQRLIRSQAAAEGVKLED